MKKGSAAKPAQSTAATATKKKVATLRGAQKSRHRGADPKADVKAETALRRILPRSLLSDCDYPEGFDSDGKRLLATTPKKELTLYEQAPSLGGRTFVVCSDKVERAYWKAIYRIKGTLLGDWGVESRERVRWAQAINHLLRFTRRKDGRGSLQLAERFRDTVGKKLVQCLKSKNPSACANIIATMMQDAVLANLRAEDLVRDRRLKTKMHPVAVLIIEAESYFCYHRKTPRKSVLREKLDQIGCGISRPGKKSKDYAGKWRERFCAAGLQGLPE